MRSHLLTLAAIALVPGGAVAATPEQVASAALRAAPVWDGHNDAPGALRWHKGNILADFDFTGSTQAADPKLRAMHTDLARLRKGKVGAQFWSVFVSSSLSDQQAVQAVMEQIDVTRRLIAANPRELRFAVSSAEVAAAMKEGRIASLLGMEGGYAVADSPAVLRQFHALGVRYMTLTHSRTTNWADIANDAPRHGGLNDLGRSMVREMQRIGMLVDLSHVSAETMMDTLDVARAPVIFSHSGAQAIDGHPRNVPDAVLARLKANRGILMVFTFPTYISEAVRLWHAAQAGEKARLSALYPDAPQRVAAGLAAWEAATPVPRATVGEVADHVDHIVKLAGVDQVGIGADFDGMEATVQGMPDVSGYPALFVELARRGYSQADLEKIASRNMMRVLREAEAFSAAHQADPPFETRTTF
jgi:membrane dipeptidase